MHPDDKKRLQREFDIAQATTGPDYADRDQRINAVKADYMRRRQSGDAAIAQQQTGAAAERRSVFFQSVHAFDMDGVTIFRPSPGLRR